MIPSDIVKPEDIEPALRCLNQYLDAASPEQKARVKRLIELCKEKCGNEDDATVMVAIAVREGTASSAIEGTSLDWSLSRLEAALDRGII